MNFEEFLKPAQEENNPAAAVAETVEQQELPLTGEAQAPVEENAVEETSVDDSQQLEVSNAVVEELAKDSVEQKEIINSLRKQVNAQQSEIATLKLKINEQNIALAKVGETLAKNAEGPESSKIALLERDTELPDRFDGETRDHVLEALKDARDAAEKDGRLRHAQILESVLCANEPNGMLAKKRDELKKLFDANANLVCGPVIDELQKLGISHKNGEEYLLPAEIMKRTY